MREGSMTRHSEDSTQLQGQRISNLRIPRVRLQQFQTKTQHLRRPFLDHQLIHN